MEISNALLTGASSLYLYNEIRKRDFNGFDERDVLNRIRLLEEALLYWQKDVENGLNGGSAIGTDNRLDGGKPNPIYRNIAVYEALVEYDFRFRHCNFDNRFGAHPHRYEPVGEQLFKRSVDSNPEKLGVELNPIGVHWYSVGYPHLKRYMVLFDGMCMFSQNNRGFRGSYKFRQPLLAYRLGDHNNWCYSGNYVITDHIIKYKHGRNEASVNQAWECYPMRKLRFGEQKLNFTGRSTIIVPIKEGLEGVLVIGDTNSRVYSCSFRTDLGFEKTLSLLHERGKSYSYIRIPDVSTTFRDYAVDNLVLVVDIEVSKDTPIVFQYDF